MAVKEELPEQTFATSIRNFLKKMGLVKPTIDEIERNAFKQGKNKLDSNINLSAAQQIQSYMRMI